MMSALSYDPVGGFEPCSGELRKAEVRVENRQVALPTAGSVLFGHGYDADLFAGVSKALALAFPVPNQADLPLVAGIDPIDQWESVKAPFWPELPH